MGNLDSSRNCICYWIGQLGLSPAGFQGLHRTETGAREERWQDELGSGATLGRNGRSKQKVWRSPWDLFAAQCGAFCGDDRLRCHIGWENPLKWHAFLRWHGRSSFPTHGFLIPRHIYSNGYRQHYKNWMHWCLRLWRLLFPLTKTTAVRMNKTFLYEIRIPSTPPFRPFPSLFRKQCYLTRSHTFFSIIYKRQRYDLLTHSIYLPQ